jgi:hypothetical protein
LAEILSKNAVEIGRTQSVEKIVEEWMKIIND